MDPLSVSASVIAVSGATIRIIQYLNEVKDAPKRLADCENELASLYGLLVPLKQRLVVYVNSYQGPWPARLPCALLSADCPASICRLDPSQAWYQAVQTLGIKNGPLAQHAGLLDEMQKRILCKNNKLTAALTWKFNKEDIGDLRQRIVALKSTIQLVLQLDQFELSKATKDDTEHIKDHAAEIKLLTTAIPSSIQQHEYTQDLQAALDWISPTNYPARQAGFISRRQAGTGIWFLNSSEFNQWKNRPRSRLLCHGMPGAGKTMIASTVIEHLGKVLDLDQHGVAYVFCNYKEHMEHANMDPLASIMKQLLQNKPCGPHALLYLYERHKKHITRPFQEEVLDALQQVLETYSSVHLVIDALDETLTSESRPARFVNRFYELQTRTDVRLLMTSRHVPEFTGQVQDAPTMEIRASDEDVRAFAVDRMKYLPKKVRDDLELADSILNTIVRVADGMFLLARLYLDQLADTHSVRDVKSILRGSSESSKRGDEQRSIYFKLYNEVMKRIQSRSRDDLAMRALSWVTLAKRPLTTNELRYALAVRDGDEDLDTDGLIEIAEIVSICAGLITVEEHTDIVRFIHYTTQEYFNSVLDEKHPKAKEYVALTCLTYLKFAKVRNLALPHIRDYSACSRLNNKTFLKYSFWYWSKHANDSQEVIAPRLMAFFKDQEIRNNIIIAPRYTLTEDATPLHVAAHFGPIRVFRMLLDESPLESGKLINTRGRNGITPLMLASWSGQTEIVKLLMMRDDVDVHLQFEKALLGAARMGHFEIVKALLAHKNIEVDAKDSRGDNCVSVAAQEGHLSIVQTCVENGAEADNRNKDGESPLVHAIYSNHENIVEYLLERKDVEVHQSVRDGGMLLDIAARRGSLNIFNRVVRAIKTDVQMNDKPRFSSKVLHNAVRHFEWPVSPGSSTSIIKQLIDMGADINARDEEDFMASPLHLVTDFAPFEIVKLLAKTPGVDLEARTTCGKTPLAKAVIWRDLSFIENMIEELNLDIYTKDSRGRSLLMLSMLDAQMACSDHRQKVEYFVQKGLSINDTDMNGKTALVLIVEFDFVLCRAESNGMKWFLRRRDLDWHVSGKFTSIVSREGHKQIKRKTKKLFMSLRRKYGTPRNCLGPDLCRRCDYYEQNCESLGDMSKTYKVDVPTIDLLQDILAGQDLAPELVLKFLEIHRGWKVARRIIARNRERFRSDNGDLGAQRSYSALLLE